MSDSHKLSLIMSSSHSGRVTGPKCHPHSAAAAAVATTIVLSFIVWVMGGGIMGTEKPRCWDPHAEIIRRRWYNNNNNNKTKSIFAAIRTRVIYIRHITGLYTHTHTRNRHVTRKGDPNFGLLACITGERIYIYLCARYCVMNRWDVRKRYGIVVCS